MNPVIIGDCTLYNADCREVMPQHVDLLFTSPPYGDLHSYGDDIREIGKGQNDVEFIQTLADILAQSKAENIVVNIMDRVRNGRQVSYDLMLAQAMENLGYPLVQKIVWFIRNKMPVASERRFSNKHEWVLHFAKDGYHFDKTDVRQPHSEYAAKDKRTWKWNANGKCPGNVWDIPAYRVAGKNKVHIAAFPVQLADRVILTYSKPGDVVYDPFMGSGTTGVSAAQNGRQFVGVELLSKYYKTACERIVKAVADKAAKQESLL